MPKKPFPDGYLKALSLFDIPFSATFAIEDSKGGSIAAVTADISCIGYRNPTSGNQDLSACYCIVTSLEQIKHIIMEGRF